MDFYMIGPDSARPFSRSASSATSGSASCPIPSSAGDRQNDVLVYGAVVRARAAAGPRIRGDINGRFNTRESENDNGLDSRAGDTQRHPLHQGSVRVDGGLLFGLTSHDPNFGFTGGRDLRVQGIHAALITSRRFRLRSAA